MNKQILDTIQPSLWGRLAHGEKVLWVGQPVQGPNVPLFWLSFTKALLLYAGFFMSIAFYAEYPLGFAIWVAVSLLLIFGFRLKFPVLITLFPFPTVRADFRRYSFYAITNLGVIVIRPKSIARKVGIYTSRSVRDVRHYRWDEIESISLHELSFRQAAVQFKAKSRFRGSIFFSDLENADDVYVIATAMREHKMPYTVRELSDLNTLKMQSR